MTYVSLPVLRGNYELQAAQSRYKYKEWVSNKEFLNNNFAFTFIDFFFIMKNLQYAYKLELNEKQKLEVERIFYDNYTIYKNGEYYIRPEAEQFGYEVIRERLDTNFWLQFQNDAQYYDLFLNCVSRRFINKFSKWLSKIESIQ